MDPLSGAYYSRDGTSAVWDSDELLEGLVVSQEKRSELFVLVSPQRSPLQIPRRRLIASELVRAMAEHPRARRLPLILPLGATQNDWCIW